MRLILSVIICFLGGSLVIIALHGPNGTSSSFRFYCTVTAGLGCLATTLALLYRPWNIEGMMRRLTVLLICFYGSIGLGALAQKMAAPHSPSVGQMIVAALSLQGTGLVFMVPFLREQGIGWREAFGFCNRWRHAMLSGLIAASLFLPIGYTLQALSVEIMTRVRLNPELQQVVQTLQMSHSLGGRIVFGLFTIVVVPPAEEMFFRGILYPWVKELGFPRLALWGSSLLFGAVHANLPSLVPLTVLGLAFTILYERTDNLLAPITAHAVFNAFNFARFCLVEGSLSWIISR